MVVLDVVNGEILIGNGQLLHVACRLVGLGLYERDVLLVVRLCLTLLQVGIDLVVDVGTLIGGIVLGIVEES